MKLFSRAALAAVVFLSFGGLALAQPSNAIPSTTLPADVQKQAVERNAAGTPKYTGAGATYTGGGATYTR